MILCYIACLVFKQLLWRSRIYKGEPRPPCVIALSVMVLTWGAIIRFLPTTHAKANAHQMHPRYLHAVWHLTRLSLCPDYSRWCWHTNLTNHSYFDYGITGKTWRPPIWAPFRDKNGTCSGISPVYMWWRFYWNIHFTPPLRMNHDVILNVMFSKVEMHIVCSSRENMCTCKKTWPKC